MTFGSYIKEKRKRLEISLRGLADLLEISATYLSDIENGRRNPITFQKLEILEKVLCKTNVEKRILYNLAGKARGTLPPDIEPYIMENYHVVYFIRIARDINLTEREWFVFINMIKEIKRRRK